MYDLIVVDKDLMAAYRNSEQVRKDRRFHIAGIFSDGQEALAFLRANRVHLMLLDVSLPSYTGLDLMRNMIAGGIHTDVIVITADKRKATLEEALRLGAMEYLIKPCKPERLKQALDKYGAYQQMASTVETAGQDTVDYLLGIGAKPMPQKNKTKQRLLQYFREHPGENATAKQLAEALGLSIVTIRRYLKQLAETGHLASEIDYQTGGHPRTLYHMQAAMEGTDHD